MYFIGCKVVGIIYDCGGGVEQVWVGLSHLLKKLGEVR